MNHEHCRRGPIHRRLRGFDCRILGIRRHPAPVPYFDGVYGLEDLDRLLPQADVVACALPETPQTVGLLTKARLRAMKPCAILVNCGRGSLLSGQDLIEVIQNGHLGGCALDVTEQEPLPPDSPLWDTSRLLLTPHISGASFGHLPETEDKIYRLAAENLRRWLEGAPLRNIVALQ